MLEEGKIKRVLLDLAEIAAERKRKRREEAERQSAAKLARMADIPTISLSHAQTEASSEASEAATRPVPGAEEFAAAAPPKDDDAAPQAHPFTAKRQVIGTPSQLSLSSPMVTLTPGQSVALTPNCAATLSHALRDKADLDLPASGRSIADTPVSGAQVRRRPHRTPLWHPPLVPEAEISFVCCNVFCCCDEFERMCV